MVDVLPVNARCRIVQNAAQRTKPDALGELKDAAVDRARGAFPVACQGSGQ